MPEMEARPPAENRHGGAPRGERPASWDAPHPAGCGSVAPHPRDNRTSAPVGAPPAPRSGWTRSQGRTRAQERAAGTKKTALFDIVRRDCGHGSLRAPRPRTRLVHAPSLSCPGRASVSERRAGTQGLHGKIDGQLKRPVVPLLGPGSRFARPGHEVSARSRARALAALGRDTRSGAPASAASILRQRELVEIFAVAVLDVDLQGREDAHDRRCRSRS